MYLKVAIALLFDLTAFPAVPLDSPDGVVHDGSELHHMPVLLAIGDDPQISRFDWQGGRKREDGGRNMHTAILGDGLGSADPAERRSSGGLGKVPRGEIGAPGGTRDSQWLAGHARV